MDVMEERHIVEPDQLTPFGHNSLDLLNGSVPLTRWLLEGLIPAAEVVLLSGREGSMKSWLALYWAKAISSGEAFVGRSAQQGRVFVLDAEMPFHLTWERLRQVGGCENLDFWHHQYDNDFPDQLDDPKLLDASKVYDLIVIDTLRRFLGDFSENSADDMAKITKKLRDLTSHGASVLALHHSMKDPTKRDYRGSSELGAGVDTTLSLSKTKRVNLVALKLTSGKSRHGGDPKMTLKCPVTEGAPVFQSGEADSQEKLVLLAKAIGGLQTSLGRAPNQTEVVVEARKQGLAKSRTTLSEWLTIGDGKLWDSQATGDRRPRSYTVKVIPVTTC